jgi:hypothetical protein
MNLARSFELCEQVVAALPTPSSSVLQEIMLSVPRPSYSSAQGVLSSVSVPQRLPLTLPPGQFAPSSYTVSVAVSSTPATTLVGEHTVCHLSPAEMEDHCHLGLCFNCDDRYLRGHNQMCKCLCLLELTKEPEEEDHTKVLPDIWRTTSRLTANSAKVQNGVSVPTSVIWSHFKLAILIISLRTSCLSRRGVMLCGGKYTRV